MVVKRNVSIVSETRMGADLACLPLPSHAPGKPNGLQNGNHEAGAVLVHHHPDFVSLVGPSPRLSLLAESCEPLFHEAGIWLPARGSIFVTSNRLERHGSPSIIVSEVDIESGDHWQYSEEEIGLRMGNGGTNFGDSGMLFCEQGYTDEVLSSLVVVEPGADGEGFAHHTILNNFHGRAFNSLNDVVVHEPSGTIWFTDPDYGREQGFKGPSQLPNQVYCFSPSSGQTRVVIGGNSRWKCNGIAFSPDWKTVYVTDTSHIAGTGVIDPTKGGYIYAFDVMYADATLQRPTFLANRRTFAFTDAGAPDGIKCDREGNVYAGCFNGVHVWSPFGDLLGKLILPNGEGCANLVFGPPGTLFIMAEKRLYRLDMPRSTAGARSLLGDRMGSL